MAVKTAAADGNQHYGIITSVLQYDAIKKKRDQQLRCEEPLLLDNESQQTKKNKKKKSTATTIYQYYMVRCYSTTATNGNDDSDDDHPIKCKASLPCSDATSTSTRTMLALDDMVLVSTGIAQQEGQSKKTKSKCKIPQIIYVYSRVEKYHLLQQQQHEDDDDDSIRKLPFRLIQQLQKDGYGDEAPKVTFTGTWIFEFWRRCSQLFSFETKGGGPTFTQYLSSAVVDLVPSQ